MSLSLRDLSFSYGSRQVLKDLTFDLPSGQFNALLGPNGAGKSTLISLITRLLALQQGCIQLEELDLAQQPRQLMKHIGVVFQQSTLDLDLTVLQNLHYHGALHGLSTSAVKQRAGEELERQGLSNRLNDKVRTLNGGHRRRVEIARALLHRPSLLLLDEPSVGLDTRSRLELNSYVRSLCQSDNLTLLWTTHLIDELQPEDHIIVLDQGRLVAQGKGQDLLKLTSCTDLTAAFEQLTGLATGDVSC
ncbi:ABC transporter ATP-binding protein [Nitrincola sp. A-D6]|uniref:ATP-binding cassette domain-containing protein n=1 Tax=Nitrincola sp. A-D6 TaxID=1545442 RepID=UPI00051FC580|nr:ATP-binding cassette domain-containing protein [Nitrincola sp. A-D6]KGK41622.1 ABC transporter ATP-binding protein [Nitrincola sp. A-D6]